jgi:hypothetical protein
MRRRSVLSRVLTSWLAIVQMAVPVLAVTADARLTADSAGAPRVHIEEHSQKACRPVHPDDCALCQLLTHLSAPRTAGPALPVATATRRSDYSEAAFRPASIFRAQARSRAPPSA